jgi:hypothetical protein
MSWGIGMDNPRYNGGLSQSEGRTVIVCRDGSWIFYYRGLLEAHLGRELRDDEVVHHINGDPTDDRLENLQVLSRAEHLALHRSELLAARRVITHCPRGHEYTPENTAFNTKGGKYCRECSRAAVRRYRQRHREAA